MLIDTHFHLCDTKYKTEDKQGILNLADHYGVKKLINVCASLDEVCEILEDINKFENVYGSLGVHPHEADTVDQEVIQTLEQLIKDNKKVIAIGECGLDYFYDDMKPKHVQENAFRLQLELARKTNLPVIIHSRDAHEDTLRIIRDFKDVKMVMHCFSYSKEIMELFVKEGCYISFAGPVTFKSARGLKDAAIACPIDRLICETDAPWLTPEPNRGKLNYPAYVKFVYDHISELRNENIEFKVQENVKRLFDI